MKTLALLVICFGAGLLARRLRSVPADGYRVLNAWVLWVALPALVVKAVHVVPLAGTLLVAAAALWVVFALAAGGAALAARRGLVSVAAAGAVGLAAGLGNTAFIGYPVLEVLGGPGLVPTAALIDQLGSFFALSFLAVPFAISLSGGALTVPAVLGRVVRFPPFVALAVALATRGLVFPPVLDSVLERLADMMSPLALASVGWQFRLSALKGRGAPLAAGLAYKMLLAPALVFAGLWAVHGGFSVVERVAVTQAAMPPMVTSAVLAAEYELDAPLASAMVALGLVVTVASVPAWWWLTGLVAS